MIRVLSLLGVALAAGALVSACAPVGLLSPYEVEEYYPDAAWGTRTTAGGCPSHTPALEIYAEDPEWFRLIIGIWDSEQTKLRKLKEPTLFVHFVPRLHISIEEQRRRKLAAIPVTSPTPYLDILLADGTRKRVPLERFEREYTWRSAASNVPLDIPPQSMTVTFPDLIINNVPLQLGAIRFTYRKSTRYPC